MPGLHISELRERIIKLVETSECCVSIGDDGVRTYWEPNDLPAALGKPYAADLFHDTYYGSDSVDGVSLVRSRLRLRSERPLEWTRVEVSSGGTSGKEMTVKYREASQQDALTDQRLGEFEVLRMWFKSDYGYLDIVKDKVDGRFYSVLALLKERCPASLMSGSPALHTVVRDLCIFDVKSVFNLGDWAPVFPEALLKGIIAQHSLEDLSDLVDFHSDCYGFMLDLASFVGNYRITRRVFDFSVQTTAEYMSDPDVPSWAKD